MYLSLGRLDQIGIRCRLWNIFDLYVEIFLDFRIQSWSSIVLRSIIAQLTEQFSHGWLTGSYGLYFPLILHGNRYGTINSDIGTIIVFGHMIFILSVHIHPGLTQDGRRRAVCRVHIDGAPIDGDRHMKKLK